MWLLARMGGGEGVISLETVILAPEDGPAAAGIAAMGAPHGLTLSPRGTQAPGGIDAAQAVPGAAIAAVTGATAANGGDPPSAGASVPPAVSVSGGDDAGARDVASGPTPDARPAVAQTRPLISDAAGVRVLDAPPLSSAGAVRLDTLSYGADGAVILQGRAAPGGRVTAQLDGASVGRVNPGADGQWTLRLPGVAPGDYRLDITREDVDGRISDRMTVPFRREAPDVIAAALGLAGARVVTVQPGATLWAIARDRYGDGTRYVQVYEANRIAIANPDLIFPGQVFDLPDPDRP
jgi:nucleoid-associated protein YgaU